MRKAAVRASPVTANAEPQGTCAFASAVLIVPMLQAPPTGALGLCMVRLYAISALC